MPIQKIADILRAAGGEKKRRGPGTSPREIVCAWLDALRPFNAGPDFDWEHLLQDFTIDPTSAPGWAKEHNILFLITLHTHREKYLVMVKESVDSEPVDPMYIVAVTVNRNEAVVRAQRALKANYEASSKDPKKREVAEVRTVWAENFSPAEFQRALDRAAVAILSEELDAHNFQSTTPNQAKSEQELVQDELEETMQVLLERISPGPPTKEEIIESWEKLPESEQHAVLSAIRKRIDQVNDRR